MLFHTLPYLKDPPVRTFNGLLASFTETQALGRVHKKPCALIAANAVWCKDMLQLTHILLLILEEVDACSSSIALCKVLLKGRMCCPSLDGQTYLAISNLDSWCLMPSQRVSACSLAAVPFRNLAMTAISDRMDMAKADMVQTLCTDPHATSSSEYTEAPEGLKTACQNSCPMPLDQNLRLHKSPVTA